ncbi:unnamed protein product, partial [marine sediment metagenome]
NNEGKFTKVMIEKTIIDALKPDPVLKTKVTLYAGEAAIFSRLAPEQAKQPYITVNITRSQTIGDLVLHDFILMVDYWDYGTSTKKAGEASERIEYIFDNKQFDHERYSSIRIWFFSGGWVSEEDPRAIHYNQQFSVRACRKKWINQL